MDGLFGLLASLPRPSQWAVMSGCPLEEPWKVSLSADLMYALVLV
jgi:hypothetical protein